VFKNDLYLCVKIIAAGERVKRTAPSLPSLPHSSSSVTGTRLPRNIAQMTYKVCYTRVSRGRGHGMRQSAEMQHGPGISEAIRCERKRAIKLLRAYIIRARGVIDEVANDSCQHFPGRVTIM